MAQAERPYSTSDFFAPSIIPEAVYSPDFRIMLVAGDNMEPGLRNGFDYVLVSPIDAYEGEGVYAVEMMGAVCLHRCGSDLAGSIRMMNDNRIYSDQSVPRDWFDEHVVGKVVADIKVRDHLRLEGRGRPTLEPIRLI